MYRDGKRDDADREKRLFIPKSARKLLLEIAHDNPLYGGHMGIKKTLDKLGKYWWPSMNSEWSTSEAAIQSASIST